MSFKSCVLITIQGSSNPNCLISLGEQKKIRGKSRGERPNRKRSVVKVRVERLRDFRDFRDIYLNRIPEKVKQYLPGCVPVNETYGA